MYDQVTLGLNVDPFILSALKEDITSEDVSTNSVMPDSTPGVVDLICKEDGIICGLPVFERVFTILGGVEFVSLIEEGSRVKHGDIIGEVKGDALNILMGERVALNLLQKMSGIATLTNKYVNELKDLNTKLLDTRKTTANLRMLEKYAVKVGGGSNHRFSLSDGILIKDNHIGYAGSIKEAIRLTKEKSSFIRKIEVETESKEDVIEALEAGADIIMLDNMSPSQVAEMVKLIDGRAITECSGNITLDTVRNYALSGVDFISSGELTHSVKAFDISLKNFIQL